jgi:hypothetical protein
MFRAGRHTLFSRGPPMFAVLMFLVGAWVAKDGDSCHCVGTCRCDGEACCVSCDHCPQPIEQLDRLIDLEGAVDRMTKAFTDRIRLEVERAVWVTGGWLFALAVALAALWKSLFRGNGK